MLFLQHLQKRGRQNITQKIKVNFSFFLFFFFENHWNYAICIYDSQHKINIEIVFIAWYIFFTFQGVTGNDGRPGEMGAPGIAGPAGVQGAQGNPGSRVSLL